MRYFQWISVSKKSLGDQIDNIFALIYVMAGVDQPYKSLFLLSLTWVRCPGFSGHGVKCPILTTVVPGFSGDLIGCTIRSKWGPFGDLYLAR